MKREDILKKLTNDEHYYGDFGKKYLSASDVGVLLNNPLALKQEQKQTAAFLVGGYFHTTILEPDKLKKYKVIPSTTRNTKLYKEMSGGELCLLQHEVDAIHKMRDVMLDNGICRDLIQGDWCDYEKPMITKIGKYMWKGKCDVLNHKEKLVIVFSAMGKVTNMLEEVVDAYTMQNGNEVLALEKVKSFHDPILNSLFDQEELIFETLNLKVFFLNQQLLILLFWYQ